ncbi:ArsC family reductase [Thiohalomonas denitrificans]|uniref:Transcriptional regulator, Spx/MgsR family n=1 Tax=Thiohalomonas denitrificans TaxID=415747 RepID=A0A1G5Q379_9GAMM|nr:ArsC family reductase [Thiohalomonas denitrificans]SCZ55759.1 transcriptional regulator, Spx/MgsR family [Thiohalomonas denitrificans]
MAKIYGIKTCDTVRKARKWLREHAIEHTFHDFRADGLPEDRLTAWVEAVGWEVLLNRRGLAWRKLPAEKKANVDEVKALELIREEPTLIKRPVLEHDGAIRVGFSEGGYSELFKN